MLDQFLETNIQNKLQILYALQSHGNLGTKELSQLMNASAVNVANLITELNVTLEGLGKIEKNNTSLALVIYDSTDFWDLLIAVYQKSDTLQCLRFLILNDTGESLTSFIEESYITKSSAYRIRKNCSDYLQLVGLDVAQNHVVGEEYRIRFLIALLHYKYGVSFPYFDRESQWMARNFILSTNDVIDMNFLEYTHAEYGYFECLLILSWKRKAYLHSMPVDGDLACLKELFVYEKIKAAVQDYLEPRLGIKYEEDDDIYLFLAYCSSNNCILSDKWKEEDVILTRRLVLSRPEFGDLLRRISARFGQDAATSPQLASILVYFYKKCLMELQCLIPDRNYYRDNISNTMTLKVVEHTRELLNKWKEDNGRHYPLDENHMTYLAMQIDIILRDLAKPVTLIVASDMVSQRNMMYMHFSQTFSPKRVNIQTLLLNAQDPGILRKDPNSVIVVNHQFKNVIQDLYLEGCHSCVLVSVSTELTSYDMESVYHAIRVQEDRNYETLIPGGSS